MAVKISELPDINEIDFKDTFLVVDRDDNGNVVSKQITFQNLIRNLDDYGTNNFESVSSSVRSLETHLENLISSHYGTLTSRIDKMDERLLTAGLATGHLYVENLSAGVPQ